MPKKKVLDGPKLIRRFLDIKHFIATPVCAHSHFVTLDITPFFLARRKQGGSQSLNDNAKGNAKSAGAQLRRYGEQALREVCTLSFAPPSGVRRFFRISVTYSWNGRRTLITAKRFGYEPVVLIGRSSWITRALSSQKVMSDCVLFPFQHDVRYIYSLLSLFCSDNW